MKAHLKQLILLGLGLLLATSSQAQWQTQSILVKPGWTAVYLHVDPSFQTLDQSVGNDPGDPITQVWMWIPPTTGQFATTPQSPVLPNSQWATWASLGSGTANTFNTLSPNAAYLIYSSAATNYVWKIKGKPVTPQYTWTTAGLNFIGFPTAPTNPPAYDAFLSLSPALQGAAQIFTYTGGNLGATNPAQLFALHTTPVTRGQAVWIRSGTVYNNYYGPFTVALQSSGGVDFSDSVSQYSFHLVNTCASNVTVTLQLLGSETPPVGQTNIVGVPPLLVRGSINPTNLTYGYTNLPLGNQYQWTLAPQGTSGSDVVVVLGLNRYQMTQTPGALFAGILKFTDSFNYTEVDVPVRAIQSSTAGLWVGNATVSQVANYLKTYQLDTNSAPVVSSNGNYVVTGINTNLGSVAAPFSLRLIIHNNGTNSVLLQHAFVGLSRYTNRMIATTQDQLDPAQLATARRISAPHLPWSADNVPWPLTGTLVPGGTLATTVTLAYDDQRSNPFLHTYHPDHDNLDASMTTELAQGYESYQISRQINLIVSPPANDFASLTAAAQSLVGYYQETMSLGGLGGASRSFNVSGYFTLNRISPISILNQP